MLTDIHYQVAYAETYTPERLFTLRDHGRHEVFPVYYQKLSIQAGQALHIKLDSAAPVSAWRVQAVDGTPQHTLTGHQLTLPNPEPGFVVVDQPRYAPLILRLDPPGPEPIPTGPTVHSLSDWDVRPDTDQIITSALQSAINTCAAKGKGHTLVVPSGRYLSGTIDPPRFYGRDAAHRLDGITLRAVTLDGQALTADYPNLELNEFATLTFE